MRPLAFIGFVLFFLFLLLTPAFAVSGPATRRVTGVTSPLRSIDSLTAPVKDVSPTQDILPIAVKAQAHSLGDISVSKRSIDTVFQQEKVSYDKIREELLQSPASEQKQLRSKLSDQRHRLLMAMLNQITVIYQRLDFTIGSLDVSLLRLHVLYSKRSIPLPDFDPRYAKLQSDLFALHVQSESVSSQLESSQSAVEMAKGIKASSQSTRSLLQHLQFFFMDYRALVQDVVSSFPQ